jgi:AbrB family looped-hinge helix DNA binding protein
MQTSTMTVKGQILVPAKIRKRKGMKKGTTIIFIEKGDDVIIKALDQNYFENLAGILGTEGEILRSLMEDKKTEREL